MVRSASLSLISEKPEEFEEETSKKSSISNGFGRNPFEEHVEQNPFDESVGPNPFEIEDRLEKLDFEEEVIEVNCRTDAYVSNVFDTVVDHLNINEHNFFGLAIFRGQQCYTAVESGTKTPPKTL